MGRKYISDLSSGFVQELREGESEPQKETDGRKKTYGPSVKGNRCPEVEGGCVGNTFPRDTRHDGSPHRCPAAACQFNGASMHRRLLRSSLKLGAKGPERLPLDKMG